MIEHAISSFEELSRILKQVHEKKSVTLYIVGHNRIRIYKILQVFSIKEIPQVFSIKEDRLIGTRPFLIINYRDEDFPKRKASFYLSGETFRAFTNYWHAYAHSLRIKE